MTEMEHLQNLSDSAFKHISNFSMGTDMADINNDGLLDILSVDMVSEDNFSQKTSMSAMDAEKFWYTVNNGFHYQYMSNSLQLNMGNGKFSEVGQLANVSNTDWSWGVTFLQILIMMGIKIYLFLTGFEEIIEIMIIRSSWRKSLRPPFMIKRIFLI